MRIISYQANRVQTIAPVLINTVVFPYLVAGMDYTHRHHDRLPCSNSRLR